MTLVVFVALEVMGFAIDADKTDEDGQGRSNYHLGRLMLPGGKLHQRHRKAERAAAIQ